jgi:uncharacterized membrane protein (DUF485 family)
MSDPFSPHQPPHPRPTPPPDPAFTAWAPYSARAGQPTQQSTWPSFPSEPLPGRHSDLRLLRSAYRRQRRWATFTALGYFVLFLVLSALAPSLMAEEVTGGLSLGLLLGLLQVPLTGVWVAMYEREARIRIEPLRRQVREQLGLDAGQEVAQ